MALTSKVTRLRIKVTNKCNYRCFFCHREGTYENDDKLTVKDIEFIAKVCTKLGITKFKITGGEPLLRQDIVDIIYAIRKHTNDDISMSTNGYYLDTYYRDLKRAGLDRIDISIHSLSRTTYKLITGVNALDRVLRSLKLVSETGFRQVKINVLVMTINIREIPSFSQSRPKT